MTSPVSSRAQADLALAVYLEPHADGRRVLLLGEAQGDLADRFDRVATHLEIIDPGAREPSHGEVPELPFNDRSFDLILVCDVSALPEPTEGAVRELHRVLARSGVLALAQEVPAATRRRRGPSPQAALARLLADEFRNVRMLGQSPIAGYALSEVEAEASGEFSIDSSLLRGKRREPERLLGLASDTAQLPIEPNLWVEVPVSAPAPVVDPSLVEELRRAEDEAREALHRETDLLRKLESERNARLDAEHLLERAKSFEQKLLAAEADYDDAVARVRYFESAIAEHEAAVGHERSRREASEREREHLRAELASAAERVKRIEHERDVARGELDAATSEHEQLEARLTELGRQVIALAQDKKHHEQTARDLLEDLRRLELDRTAVVEHDARVTELEAERDRAVQRALEAEVAREAAQMRADELRSELEAEVPAVAPRGAAISAAALAELRESAAEHEAQLARSLAELARLRGECHGLRLRLSEAELALGAVSSPGEQLARATSELSELRFRFAHTEAALHAMREATPRPLEHASTTPRPSARESELSQQLSAAERRLAELMRELEEADRFAELHAEDAERFVSVEAELDGARSRLEELEEEVRVLDGELRNVRDELRVARESAEHAEAAAESGAAESRAQLDQIMRLERERDDARAALAEARSMLSQLAGRVGADENDPPSIMQAFLAQGDARESERQLDDARAELAERDARIAQLERWLADAQKADAGEGSQANDAPEY